MNRWRLWIPLAIFAGFVVLAGIMLARPKEELVQSRMVGKPAPAIALAPAVPGRPGLASADFATGQPRLLNVFASWCVPCIAEAPRLAELAERGVIIDGIAIRDRREDLEAFLARHGNPYRAIGADDRSEVQIALGSAGVPETFVIDGQGTVTYQHIGEIRPEHIPLLLEKLEAAGG